MSRQTSLEEHIRRSGDCNVSAQAADRARKLENLQSNKFWKDYSLRPTDASPVVVNSLFGLHRSFGSKSVDADEGIQSFLRHVYEDVNAFTSDCNGSISVSHPNCVHRLVLDIDAEISSGYKDREHIDVEFKLLIDKICHELFSDFTENNCNKSEFVQEWMSKIKVFISYTRIRTRSRDVSKAGAHVVFHNFPMWPEFSKFFGNKVVEFVCQKLKNCDLPWCKGGIDAILDAAIYKENSTSLRLFGVQKVKECARCPKPPNGGFPIWLQCRNSMCMAGKAWEHNSDYRCPKDKHYTLKLDNKRKQPHSSTNSFFLKDNTNNGACPSDNPISNHCLVMLQQEREWVHANRSQFEALFLNWCFIHMSKEEHARLKKLKKHPNEIPTVQHLQMMKTEVVDSNDVDFQEILPNPSTRSIFEEISNCLDCYSSGIFTIQQGDRVVNTTKRKIVRAWKHLPTLDSDRPIFTQTIEPMTVGVASRCNTIFWRTDSALYEWNKHEQIFVEDDDHIGIVGVGSKVKIDGVLHEVKESSNFADVSGSITLVENFAHAKKKSKLVYAKTQRHLGYLMQAANHVHVWDEFTEIKKFNQSKDLIEKTVSCDLATIDTHHLGEMNVFVSWEASYNSQEESTYHSSIAASNTGIKYIIEVFSSCERYPQMGPKLEVSSIRSWKKRAHLFLKNGICFNKGDQRHSSHTGMIVVVKDDTNKGMFPVCNCFCNKERGKQKKKCFEFNRNAQKKVIHSGRDKTPYNTLLFWKPMPKDNPFNFILNNMTTGTAMEETNRVYGPDLFGKGLQPHEVKRVVKSKFSVQRLPDPHQVVFCIWNFNTCMARKVKFAHLERFDEANLAVINESKKSRHDNTSIQKVRQACTMTKDCLASMQCDILPTIRRNLSIGVKPLISMDEDFGLVKCGDFGDELQGFNKKNAEDDNSITHHHLWELHQRMSYVMFMGQDFIFNEQNIINQDSSRLEDILCAVRFRQEAKTKKKKMDPAQARKYLDEKVLFEDPDDESEQASISYLRDIGSVVSQDKSLGYESEISEEGSVGSLKDFITDE